MGRRPSSLERLVLDALRAFPQYEVRTEVRIGGKYRVDVLIGRLVLEVQGAWTHSSPADQERDGRRACYLHDRGYEVVYVTEQEIRDLSPLGLIDHLDVLLRKFEYCTMLPCRHL